jgi:hypothetical protein
MVVIDGQFTTSRSLADLPVFRAAMVEQFGPTTYGIFDAFPDDSGWRAHVNGQIPKLFQGGSPQS